MDGAAIWGIVRTILAAFSGYIVAKGWVDDATYQSVLGALGTIFVAVWSVFARKSATTTTTTTK